ncbi:hypothetical protein ACFO4E_24545 [Nocardiopsis mangrovi]|uniref:DUF1876 domain-containing protein n=1 Tax=Nocardiopsis mangrovi TaxID=1179818 RepID=A0ABV9E2V7_9ACTN
MTSILHPRASGVSLTRSDDWREITLTVGPGADVVLYPGAEDHDAQVAALDRIIATARTARSLMDQARRDQRPVVPG